MDPSTERLWRQAGGRRRGDGRRRHRRPWWLLVVAGAVALVVTVAIVLAGIHDDTSGNPDQLAQLQAELDKAAMQRDELLRSVQGNTVLVGQLVARIRQLEQSLQAAGVDVPAPNAAAGGAQGPGGSRGPAGPPGAAGGSGGAGSGQPRATPTPRPTPGPSPSPTRCTVRDPVTGRCVVPGLGSSTAAAS